MHTLTCAKPRTCRHQFVSRMLQVTNLTTQDLLLLFDTLDVSRSGRVSFSDVRLVLSAPKHHAHRLVQQTLADTSRPHSPPSARANRRPATASAATRRRAYSNISPGRHAVEASWRSCSPKHMRTLSLPAASPPPRRPYAGSDLSKSDATLTPQGDFWHTHAGPVLPASPERTAVPQSAMHNQHALHCATPRRPCSARAASTTNDIRLFQHRRPVSARPVHGRPRKEEDWRESAEELWKRGRVEMLLRKYTNARATLEAAIKCEGAERDTRILATYAQVLFRCVRIHAYVHAYAQY
jgi:hypothetical protein